MEEDTAAKYLSNLVLVAHADGVLDRREETAIEASRIAIGAKKRNLKQGMELASGGSIGLLPGGQLSDHIRNLEDMATVALSDGEYSDSEAVLLKELLSLIELPESILNRILSNAATMASASDITCTKCSAINSNGAKFCPECGTLLGSPKTADAIRLDFEYPPTGVAIEFAESTGVSFPAALAAAKAAPEFQECLRGKKKWYLAAWPQGLLVDALALTSNLSGLRNKKITIDGENRDWDEMLGFSWCWERRMASYEPKQYCFGQDHYNGPNLWGCQNLDLNWNEHADWLTYGKFVNQTNFRFDKDRIRHALEKGLHGCRNCPAIREDYINKLLDAFPENVRVGKGHDWDYIECHGGRKVSGSIKVDLSEPDEDGHCWRNEIHSNGAFPKDIKFAKDLISRAIKRSHTTDITEEDVLV